VKRETVMRRLDAYTRRALERVPENERQEVHEALYGGLTRYLTLLTGERLAAPAAHVRRTLVRLTGLRRPRTRDEDLVLVLERAGLTRDETLRTLVSLRRRRGVSLRLIDENLRLVRLYFRCRKTRRGRHRRRSSARAARDAADEAIV